MSKLIQQLSAKGFLQAGEFDSKPIYYLTTPCRFNIKQNVVKSLKENYLSDEEIGGVLWIKPAKVGEEKVYIVEQVSFIRNAIEDTVYKDKNGRVRTKKDAYRPDHKTLTEELNKIFSSDHLPVKFHSHPTKREHILEQLTIQQIQTETSEQDRIESNYTHQIGNDNLLMPRGLIVGNGDFSNDIFIGLYNGFIAPVEFENSKKKIQLENFQKTTDLISSINLSDGQKAGLVIGAALLFLTVVKYPKYSLPVIIGLGATLPLLMTNTHNIDNPNYFNKLSFGDANICIP